MNSNRRSFLKAAVAMPLAVKFQIVAAEAAQPAAPMAATPVAYPWRWWFSYDGGEVFNDEFYTKEAALDFLLREGEGIIAECQRQDYDLSVNGDSVFEMLLGQNEELIGEGEFLDRVTAAEVKDLGYMVTAAIDAWVAKHRIDIAAWSFAGVRNKIEADPVTGEVKEAAE